jgi:hypothetical protein
MVQLTWKNLYISGTVPAASIREETLTFCRRFLKNVCSTNILVLTGQQHQYIGAIQREEKCEQHRALFG